MKRIYNITDFYRTKAKQSQNVTLHYCSLMSIRAEDISVFMTHCKDIASLIIKGGLAANITDPVLRRRKSLGLPPIEVNKTDLKKLASLTGLVKKIGESK